MKNIGVLLAGCGNKDGSEIYESTFTVLALSQCDAKITFIAPNRKQMDVFNYVTDTDDNDVRDILKESARIARGEIIALDAANPETLDGLIIPGGLGAAKNFSSFVEEGLSGKLRDDVAKFIDSIHRIGKPIGAICISPVLLMLHFKDTGFKVTPGLDKKWKNAEKKMGVNIELLPSSEIAVDEKMKIVTTPAFMNDASHAEVFEGISKLVKKVVEMS